ncbi:helix-turn-helix domain-containing protein [Paractinoplanes atraurantiacus]|uniref:Helix-turn-helix domain-containing protein n=1 Tax=Paractinoplanes atraurantiacus TaxID=1036182 RepID=A0A285JB51_9ACTN|nr:helix-turn-helix transcriptional regulator [Actinoplanes atraurantiacus]SNY57323.1 Helix-turn-helix domain-containing protein [Actinoplanes atraurantiacus]
MADGDSPTIARPRMRIALREAREAADVTQVQVADEMEWSLSKVIRIENGDVAISQNDLPIELMLIRLAGCLSGGHRTVPETFPLTLACWR